MASLREPILRRDAMGRPHVSAADEAGAYLGLGIAMAEDRPHQMDRLRRRARGRLAEVDGEAGLEQDVEARIIDFAALAGRQLGALPSATAAVLVAFSEGVNRRLPPELEPWTPGDSLAVLKLNWWLLSGRLNLLAAAEVALRALPPGLAAAFLQPAGDRGTVADPLRGTEAVGTGGVAADFQGSNCWVIAGTRTLSGSPLLAGDPHNPFALPSQWYEARLRAPGFDAGGICYPGVPAVVHGRSARVAWGCTNNICSTRDLYLEDARAVTAAGWARIEVAGGAPVRIELERTERGPIVNRLLPAPLREGPPLSLRWTGFAPADEVGCMLAAARSGSVAEWRAAMAGWVCPTRCYHLADIDGRIAFQTVGSIPLRGRRHLGVRRAGDPVDAWVEERTTTALPHGDDPARGWIASANCRIDRADEVTEQGGYFGSSHRLDRIAELLESRPRHSPEDARRDQADTLSLRARRVLPALLAALGGQAPPELARWDCRFDLESRGAPLFEAFFTAWQRRVVRARFGAAEAALVGAQGGGLAEVLVETDTAGWFPAGDRREQLRAAWSEGLAELERRLGDDRAGWTWGAAHHLASPMPSRPVSGTLHTLSNTNGWDARGGATHRLVIDLAPPGQLLSTSTTGASEDPASPHHLDGLERWLAGELTDLWPEPE